MIFFVGLHQPHNAINFDRCMISIKRLARRKGNFVVNQWMLDSGAFTELRDHGRYRDSPEVYASQIIRWAECGELVSASAQDYLCEPFILAKTGLTIAQHQQLTIDRYDALRALVPEHIHIMPVLQGYMPSQYIDHLAQYGQRIYPGMWVGVGSVCKRQRKPSEIAAVLRPIKAARPDIQLHGFGAKTIALDNPEVRSLLHSADSMAWSSAAYWEGRDANDWREAEGFRQRIETAPPVKTLPMDQYWSNEYVS